MSKRESTNFFTPEREQKLDLIRHLLTNGKRPILLRAPRGAGKSFLLDRLSKQLGQHGQTYYLSVNLELLDAKAISSSLAEVLHVEHDQLTNCLSQKSERGERLYLLLDDVQLLEGPEFESLLGYFGQFDAVRMVLGTSENLDVVESWCQVIDLEPFSQKQTAQYAKYLLERDAVNSTGIANLDELVLFIETGGLPGRIHDAVFNQAITPVPTAKVSESTSLGRWGLISVVALAIGGLVLFVLYSGGPEQSHKVDSGKVNTQQFEQPSAKPGMEPEVAQVKSDIRPVEPIAEVSLKEESRPSIESDVTKATASPVDEVQKPIESSQEEATVENAVSETVAQEKGVEELSQPVDDVKPEKVQAEPAKKKLTRLELDRAWIASMPKEQFSFQIMGLGSLDAAKKFVEGQSDPQNLYIYRSTRNNGQWYGILYGVYADRSAATDAIPEVKQRFSGVEPWARSFESIQKDLYQ